MSIILDNIPEIQHLPGDELIPLHANKTYFLLDRLDTVTVVFGTCMNPQKPINWTHSIVLPMTVFKEMIGNGVNLLNQEGLNYALDELPKV